MPIATVPRTLRSPTRTLAAPGCVRVQGQVEQAHAGVAAGESVARSPNASGSDRPAMKIRTMPTSRTPRSTRDSSSSAFAAHTKADQAHHTGRAAACRGRSRPTTGRARETS